MGTDLGMHVWAGRVCMGLVAALSWMGFYFANIRFLPIAAGFAILAVVCYTAGWRRRPAVVLVESRSSHPQ